MKKILAMLFVGILLSISLVSAIEDHQVIVEEGKKLVDSEISCDKLTDEQLETIGEYFMEQMHPGEAHEIMDEMMGGGGSESLKQVHINMARRLYCNDNIYVGYGMMNGGMMGMMGGNMMGNPGYGFGYWNFINILYLLLLIGIITLVYLGIVKLWKSTRDKGGRK